MARDSENLQPDFHGPQKRRPFTQARPRPVPVWIIFLVLFVQGVAVLWYTVGSALTSEGALLDTVGVVALVVLYALLGAVLMILGFRIFMGAGGARTPAMVLQFMVVVISFSFLSGGAVGVGLTLMLPAAATLVLLFVRSTQEWLDR